MKNPVPDPFVIRGHSTLYGEDGAVKLQWVKTQLDNKKHLELIKEIIDELRADLKPVDPVSRKITPSKANCLTYIR